jgi:transcriptional regulator with XRE-family HTH domain
VDPLQLLDIDSQGPELEALRLAAGLSLQAIAAAVGTSVSRYRRIERGARLEDPPGELVERLASVLSVPPGTVRAAVDISRRAAASRRHTGT